MRSTLEIIIAVKECQPVTMEELRLALLAVCSMEHFIREDLKSLIDAVNEGKPSAKMRAAFSKDTLERMFHARKKSPDEWLEPSNIPGNPEHDQRYKAGLALLDKVEAQMKAKGTTPP